jgi:hypothetical protein
MTLVAIRHTLSAITALALVTAFTSGPLLAAPPDRVKANRTIKCDCSNCSAQHCKYKPSTGQWLVRGSK